MMKKLVVAAMTGDQVIAAIPHATQRTMAPMVASSFICFLYALSGFVVSLVVCP